MNNRPITPVSNVPQVSEALTRNYLLLLRRNSSLPPDKSEGSNRFKGKYEFWQRWTKEYFPTLNFKVGDLVLKVDKNTPRRL